MPEPRVRPRRDFEMDGTVDQASDADLIVRCRAGELAAYRLLYDRYGASLLRMAMGIVGCREDAEDAVQDAFLRLYRAAARIVPDREGLIRAYLFRILRNACLDTLRKRRGKNAAEVDVETLAAPVPPEERLTFEAALDSLPPRMRECFVLAAVEQLKYHEIAGVLGLSLGTVKATIHHARARLQAFLAPEGTGREAAP